MVANDLVMPMAWIHLSCLGSHLVILSPVLLCSDTMEMTCAFLIARAIQVHAFVNMVIYMQRIYREGRSSH